ncbi:MAG: hypothetical protein ACK4V2_03245 [Pseudomonadota bacterium]|jgi:hypothetical protein|nr:hypothetical protein [Alphaproteobacteria bacterium]
MKISLKSLSLSAFILCGFFSKECAGMDFMDYVRAKGHPVFAAHSRNDRARVMQYLEEDSSSSVIAINGVGESILYDATSRNDAEMVTKILRLLPLFTVDQQKSLFETQPVVPGFKGPSLLTRIQNEDCPINAEIKEQLLNYWNALISSVK